MPVLSLGYLRLESTDLDGWRTFAGDFLGLMPVAADGEESLRYRMDHYPPRLVVSPGAESRATAIGFEVLNERDLRRTVAAVEDAGIKVAEGTVAESDERRVTGSPASTILAATRWSCSTARSWTTGRSCCRL